MRNDALARNNGDATQENKEKLWLNVDCGKTAPGIPVRLPSAQEKACRAG